MWDKILDVAIALVPPPNQDKRVLNHDYILTSMVICMAIALGIKIYVCGGLLVWLSTDYASASDLALTNQQLLQTRQQIVQLERTNLDSELFNTKQKECAAVAGSKDVFTQRLNSLLYQYYNITKQAYHLPDCGEF